MAHGEALEAARRAFVRANELARNMRWAEALAEFDRSYTQRPHAVTLYNMALCERALGRYTRARLLLSRALDRARRTSDELPEDLHTEVRGYLSEIDRLLAQVELELRPSNARLMVDGQPLARGERDGQVVYYAGVRGPGAPERVGPARFTVVLDPGVHLFVFTRPGFRDVLIRRELAPGSRDKLPLALESLPGSLVVTSSVRGAIVKLNGLDVGAAPVSLSRPPGSYSVRVEHPKHVTYRTDVTLSAGEEVSLRANLQLEPEPITRRFWFWAGIAGVLAGTAVTTWAIAEHNQSAPPPNGGTLGWVVDLR